MAKSSALVPEASAWFARAECAGTPTITFFHRDATDTALRICAGCRVRKECLAYALAEGLRGVWGGLTDAERKTRRGAST